MDEKVIIAELTPAVNTLKTLALVALDMEDAHPQALPEPPNADEVAEYERQMTAIAQQVNPRHRTLPMASLRDYKSGFPDRAATYLEEMVNDFLQDAEYASAFSAAAKSRLKTLLVNLRDV